MDADNTLRCILSVAMDQLGPRILMNEVARKAVNSDRRAPGDYEEDGYGCAFTITAEDCAREQLWRDIADALLPLRFPKP